MNSLPDKGAGVAAPQFDMSMLGNMANIAKQNNRNDIYDRLMPILQKFDQQVPRQQQAQ